MTTDDRRAASLEARAWRRFYGLVLEGTTVRDALSTVSYEMGVAAFEAVHTRLRSVVLAIGNELEVGA